MLRPLLVLMSFPYMFYITSFLHHTNHLYSLICSVYCSTEIFVHVRAHPHKWGRKLPHPHHKTLSREGIFDVLFMILGLSLERRLGSGGSVIWKTSTSCQLFIFCTSVDLCALVRFEMNEGSKVGLAPWFFVFFFSLLLTIIPIGKLGSTSTQNLLSYWQLKQKRHLKNAYKGKASWLGNYHCSTRPQTATILRPLPFTYVHGSPAPPYPQ